MTEKTPQPQSSKQQAREAIQRAGRIVVTSHVGPDADAVGSSLALALALRKLGKEVQVVLADPVPEALAWLPGADLVRSEFSGGRTLKVEINATGEQIDSLRYETEGGKLSVIIEPKGDPISPDAVRVRGGAADYDLLIALDSPTFEYLGDIGLGQDGQPVLVVDHHPSNEKFGTVNWVDPEAAATAEMLLSLIESLGENILDADIATNLQAGLISDTGSFQHNTRAKTLSVAATLVAAGADQARLVSSLMNPSHAPTTLRLWGHALSSLRFEPEIGLAWAEVTSADVSEQGSPEHWGSATLMNTLLKHVQGAQLVALFTEPEPGTVNVSFRVPDSAPDSLDAAALAAREGGGGHRQAAGFRKEATSLDEVKEALLPRLRQHLKAGPLEQPKPPTTPDLAPQPSPVLPTAEETPLPVSAAERTVPPVEKREPRVWQPDEPRA